MNSGVSPAIRVTFPTSRVEISTYFHTQSQHRPVWNIQRALMRQMQLLIHCMCLLSTHKAQGSRLPLIQMAPAWPWHWCLAMVSTSSHTWQDGLTWVLTIQACVSECVSKCAVDVCVYMHARHYWHLLRQGENRGVFLQMQCQRNVKNSFPINL